MRDYKGDTKGASENGLPEQLRRNRNPYAGHPSQGSARGATVPGVPEGRAEPLEDRPKAPNASFTSFSFITRTESEQVLAGNAKRSYLAIQNRGSNAVFIGFGQKADDSSFRLVAGAFYEPFVAPRTSLNILGATAGDNIVVIEGVG